MPLQYNPLLVKKKKKGEEKPNERLENKIKEKGLTSELKEGGNKEEIYLFTHYLNINKEMQMKYP